MVTRFDATIVGVGVLDEPGIRKPVPLPIGVGAYKKARDEARLADADARVRRALAEYLARSAAVGVRAEALEEVGDPSSRILRETQRCDVVLLGRETHFRFETQNEPDETLGRILRSSPRLLVMGAQGHHPMRDLFVTSVTRAVLRSCPVPVFIGA